MMAAKHHDTGYKEVFSYPEFVQQLMDFSTLQNHSGNYITPLFEEKLEDVVWSVEIARNDTGQQKRQRVYLYILLEFQSQVDQTMPIRLMHYVACFYDHLLKNSPTTPSEGLPPVFPVVLYNGSRRWRAAQDIYQMIQPEPPSFLSVYQPHLPYYLIDEGSYSDDMLDKARSPLSLSALFGIENAGTSWESLRRR